MGAGFLPVCVKNGKIMFLFGKERDRPNETARGFADFGGGAEKGETTLDNVSREGAEELSGFLGDANKIRALVQKKRKVVLNVEKYKYTTYIIPISYDKMLPIYFNNQSKFLDTYYNQNLLHNTTMYEKKEIRWFSFSELKKKRFMFRNFYREMIDLILENKRNVERLFGLQSIIVKNSKKIKRNNRKKTKKLNVTIKPSKKSTMKVFKLF